LRDFNACCLCLQRARTPLCCTAGHLFCKECIYEDLLAQRTEHERLQRDYERKRRQEEQQQQHALLEEQRRAEEEFTRQQMGVRVQATATLVTGSPSKLRKAERDKELPSFWLPSKAPDHQQEKAEKVKREITCPHGRDHAISLKKLIPVQWTTEQSASSSEAAAAAAASTESMKQTFQNETLKEDTTEPGEVTLRNSQSGPASSSAPICPR
jgi:nitric oxide synthase-interacting protein